MVKVKKVLILQAGMAKSGNYWLWRILQNILHHSNIEILSYVKQHPSYKEVLKLKDLSHSYQQDIDVIDIEKDGCYFRISSIFREKIADVEEYLKKTTHIWTHSVVSDYTSVFIKDIDKVVYVIRDPRDVAISQAKFAFTPYMQKYYPHFELSFESYLNHRFEWIIRNWVLHVEGWLSLSKISDIHIIYFESLKENFNYEIRRLSEYLDLPLSDTAINEIKDNVSFKNMRKKDPNHVRKGSLMGWADILDENMNLIADKYAGGMLSLLGYPRSNLQNSNRNLKKIVPTKTASDFTVADLRSVSDVARWKKMDYVKSLFRVLMDDRPVMAKYQVLKQQFHRFKLL